MLCGVIQYCIGNRVKQIFLVWHQLVAEGAWAPDLTCNVQSTVLLAFGVTLQGMMHKCCGQVSILVKARNAYG